MMTAAAIIVAVVGAVFGLYVLVLLALWVLAATARRRGG